MVNRAAAAADAGDFPSARVTLALAAALLAWAASFAGIRAALPAYGPVELALGRFVIASVVLAVYVAIRPVRLPAAREWPGIAGLAVVGLVVYHLALNTGERTTTAGSASLLIATVPLFTALFAMPVTGERQHPAQLVGLGVGFAGAAVIALGERGGLRADRGALLVLLAAAATAAYFAWQKPYLRRCQPAALLAVTIWIATVVLLPWLPAWIGQLRAAPATATVALAFLGVVPTAIAYLAWSWALARRSATLTASSLYVLPALAIGIAWLWLGEVPRPMALAGGALALVGVAITQLGARPPGTPADPPAMPATPCVSGARVTDMERGHDRAQIPAHGRT